MNGRGQQGGSALQWLGASIRSQRACRIAIAAISGSYSEPYGTAGLTPFAAVEGQPYHRSLTESSPANGALGLSAARQTSESCPVFAGPRLDGIMPVGTMAARPLLQVAHVHEFTPDRNLVTKIVPQPGASFEVEGARPSKNSAQVKTAPISRCGRV